MWPREPFKAAISSKVCTASGVLPGCQTETGTGVLSEAMVRFAARQEMACGVEDVLARRNRLLFLDARQAQSVARDVGEVLSQELGDRFDAAASVRDFVDLAEQYASCP